MNTPTPHDALEAALASLPRELQPPRDLWPPIASALPAPARAPAAWATPWPLALAASLAIVGLASALAWSAWRTPGERALRAQQRPAAAAATRVPASLSRPQDAAYVAARVALEKTFRERLELLAPGTRTRVEADLEIIRKANANIGAALARDPASPLLQQLLRSTWQQEIDLYTNVARTTETMLTRRT